MAGSSGGSLGRLADLRRRRTLVAWLTLVIGLPLLTVVLLGVATDVSLESALLLYLLMVVVVALLGGVVPALVAAVAADLLVNYYFVPPVHTFHIASRDQFLAIVVFVVVAVVVSVLVEISSRRREEAARSRAEADLLSRLTDAPVGEVTTEAVLEEIRRDFGMSEVTLVRDDGTSAGVVLARVGSVESRGSATQAIPAGPGLRVVVTGPEQFALDRGSLRRLALAAARVSEERQLKEQADEARRLAELDRTRAALLAAVGHDLRTPLAGVKAGVSSLRQSDVEWTAEERDELLATVEESADRLDDLVTNLLDATRIQAGAVVVDRQQLGLDEVVLRALMQVPEAAVTVQVPITLPLVDADPVLLERVVDNLVSNALRFTPSGVPVEIAARAQADRVLLDVVDHGPGLPPDAGDQIFEPFQRLDDASQSGTGLGLAIAKGFCAAMDATLEPLPTPGGGLTMRVSLAAAS